MFLSSVYKEIDSRVAFEKVHNTQDTGRLAILEYRMNSGRQDHRKSIVWRNSR